MVEIKKNPDYSVAKGASKAGAHGVLAVVAWYLSGLIPGITPELHNAAAGGVLVVLEFLRNTFKSRVPGVFTWL